MKETLSPENRKDIVRYRLERAEDSINEAKYTYDASMYNLATNRLYYACFYAASALLIYDGVEASTHSGVKTQFSKLYILTDVFSRELGTILNILFNLRHSTDYEDFINSDAATVALYMPRVENFVQSIRDRINQSDPEYLLK